MDALVGNTRRAHGFFWTRPPFLLDASTVSAGRVWTRLGTRRINQLIGVDMLHLLESSSPLSLRRLYGDLDTRYMYLVNICCFAIVSTSADCMHRILAIYRYVLEVTIRLKI